MSSLLEGQLAEAQEASGLYSSQVAPWSSSRLLPYHHAACQTSFPESLVCAENGFPGKVSPVKDGARIKGFLKKTQGNLLSLKTGLFPAHVGLKCEGE